MDFKSLQKLWYDKLKASGFNDIECGELGSQYETHGYLKNSKTAPKRVQTIDFDIYTSTLEYYSIAGEYLHTHKWTDYIEQQIWEQYCNGQTLRQIAKHTGKSIFSVHHTIKEINANMWSWWNKQRNNDDNNI